MKHTVLGLITGILLTVLVTQLFDCGHRPIYIEKEVDSLTYEAAKEEGRQEILTREKTEADSSLSQIATKLIPVKKRYQKAKAELDSFQLKDTLSLVRALVEDNYKCREVVRLADTVIRNMEMQLVVATSRMKIDDSLEVSLLSERLKLKNIIRLQEAQIYELSETSWFEEHKFELGFLAGAAAVTAAVLTIK